MSYKYKAIKVNGKKHDLHRYLWNSILVVNCQEMKLYTI